MNTSKSVYFMRPVGEQGPIKIGCTCSPIARLAQIQSMSPAPLEIAAVALGDNTDERSLHNRFSEARLHGEWFGFTPEIGGVIDHIVLHGELPPCPIIEVNMSDVYHVPEFTIRRKRDVADIEKIIEILSKIEQRALNVPIDMTTLCAESGVAGSTISRWRAGRKPRAGTLNKLYRRLDELESTEN